MKAPSKGDLVYMNFDPQAGHEQAGFRPAIVLSPKKFNEITGFVSVCPITNTVRGWGYEVPLPDDAVFKGVILVDQIRNLDWRVRKLRKQGEASEAVVATCIKRIHTFLN